MIDPRFANAGGFPLMSAGFGTQQVPIQYHHHHHHRHHRHHKQKVRNDESPVSRDESIHKVDHSQHHLAQITDNDVPTTNGYNVPFGNAGFEGAYTPGFPQQKQYNTGVLGYANQHPGASNGDEAFIGTPLEQTIIAHRRHRRHHRRHHTVEAENTGNQEQEQAISDDRRSSSVVSNEGEQTRSPVPLADDDVVATQATQQRHHLHHHRGGEYSNARQSRQPRGHTAAGPDGYGHINSDLIFIERGDHSPHRQDAPVGYEYKGKIEVQGIDRERRSRSHGSGARPQAQATVPPTNVAATQVPQTTMPTPNCGPCPPGWQQMVMSANPGALSYSGQVVGTFGNVQTGYGGYGMGSFGMPAIGGGYANYGTGMSYLPQCQYMSDYTYGQNTGAAATVSGAQTGYQQPIGTGVTETRRQSDQVDERVSDRPTIIEVWQRRSKSEKRTEPDSPAHSRTSTPSAKQSPSRHTHRPHINGKKGDSPYDLERFRNELLDAIKRMVPRGGSTVVDVQPSKGHGGTQTQIRPSVPDEPRPKLDKKQDASSGEVRVIVQPIQPVFYMPKQSGGTAAPVLMGAAGAMPRPEMPQVGSAPVTQPQQIAGGANVVYVPRNVYVPVIKPVFVPRERVIVRPQVIHVARPVLVDRPVPVTQRPIIIDRERPVPVPVRGGTQTTAQATDANATQENYVYRDNLPFAYGGRCAEFSGGANYGYTAAQEEHQYAASSTQETSNVYQAQMPSVDVNISDQYQQNQSTSQFETQAGAAGSFHGSYTNLIESGASYNADINNEYLTAQTTQQYTTDSTHETANIYQTESSNINVNVPSQYQPSQSISHFHMQQGGNIVCTNEINVQQPYENLVQAAGASAGGAGQIEILDAAVNPNWQKSDPSSLVRRYGRPAFDIVHKSEEVEQQMYNELRQQESTSSMIRHSSTASYGSGSGIGFNGSDMLQY